VVAGLMRTDGVRAIADTVERGTEARAEPRSGAVVRPLGRLFRREAVDGLVQAAS